MIACILLVGSSVSYYFYIFLPREQTESRERDFIFSKKNECLEIGEKLYQNDLQDLEDRALLVPQYAYNKDLNTCLYFNGYVGTDFSEQWVKDSFTNNQIISYMRYREETLGGAECPSCLSIEAFKTRKAELFSE